MTSVVATKCASLDELFEAEKPGSFCIKEGEKWFYCECPCGCGHHMNLPIHRAEETDGRTPSWIWNGDRDKPTLQPSIRDVGSCFYHGHITEGVWTFEGDSGVNPN